MPEKIELRRAALERRDALPASFRADASHAIAEQVLRLPELSGAAPVGAYWPMRSEVDCRPLMTAVAARGQGLALPFVSEHGLRFRAWRPGDTLVAGGFGTRIPSSIAPEVEPRLLIVPLAAFDRARHRIGYGKGYYDRGIAGLDTRGGVKTIGLAFACQEVMRIPVEDHDRRLDVIVTEDETIVGD